MAGLGFASKDFLYTEEVPPSQWRPWLPRGTLRLRNRGWLVVMASCLWHIPYLVRSRARTLAGNELANFVAEWGCGAVATRARTY